MTNDSSKPTSINYELRASNQVLTPRDKEKIILQNCPALKEIYHTDAIAHVIVDSMATARDEWDLIVIIEHLLVANKELREMHLDAALQGYKPPVK
jgi:hypothetical protein